MKDRFDELFKKLYPDYRDGEAYDFSNGTVTVTEEKRYKEISKIVDESMKDTSNVKISNDVFHFL